jgi:hypothetical protein
MRRITIEIGCLTAANPEFEPLTQCVSASQAARGVMGFGACCRSWNSGNPASSGSLHSNLKFSGTGIARGFGGLIVMALLLSMDAHGCGGKDFG